MKTVVDRHHKAKNPPAKGTLLAATAPNSRARSHVNSQTNGAVTKIVKTIDQLYNKVANIPLSTLLGSPKPDEWLKEQDETLLRLARKVGTDQKAPEKLQAIENILSNIRTNLGMWNKIDLMKNYQTSNANTDQELSSKDTTKSIRPNQDLLSYHQYEIRAKQSTRKQKGDIGSIQAQTVRSENSSDHQFEDKENLNTINMKMTKEKGKRSNYRGDNLCTKRNEQIADSHYLQIIKELRVQLTEKDRQLENMLINEQSYQETLQLHMASQGQLKMENTFLRQRLDNATVMLKEKEAAAQAARERQAQLKEGIRLERQRFKRQVQFRDETQDRYSSYMDENVRLRSRLEQLEAQIKDSKKQEKVSVQKMAIYTSKYHKLWNQLEKSKEQVSALKGELRKRECESCDLSTLKEDVGRSRRDIISRCQV